MMTLDCAGDICSQITSLRYKKLQNTIISQREEYDKEMAILRKQTIDLKKQNQKTLNQLQKVMCIMCCMG